jgi:hypothetical protein
VEHRLVTVFGGAEPTADEPAYLEAMLLGSLLAKAGYILQTGGYIGTMEAASRGAVEAGGHVIGVTCDEIEAWRPVRPNRWVIEERRFPTLRQRLYALVDSCAAALALPGGIGTLSEVAVMWSQMQTRASAPRPLILVGPQWQAVLETFYTGLGRYIKPADWKLLYFSPEAAAAVDVLKTLLPSRLSG